MVAVYVATVQKAYHYKMTGAQRDWWTNMIADEETVNAAQCAECTRLRGIIAVHNLDIAAASRAAREPVRKQEEAKKRIVQRELKAHLIAVEHDKFRIRILSDLIEKLQDDSSEEDEDLDFTASCPTPAGCSVGSVDSQPRQPTAQSRPVVIPVPVPDRREREPDPWPCFVGRQPPMVMQGAQLPVRLRKALPAIKVGDFVVVKVIPDQWWTLDWQVAKVSAMDIAAEKITVRLYGNHKANANGVWYAGWWHHVEVQEEGEEGDAVPKSKRRRRRGGAGSSKITKKKVGPVVTDYPQYGSKKQRAPFKPFVIDVGPDSVIDWGFKLRKNGHLLAGVLKLIDHNPRVQWSLEA